MPNIPPKALYQFPSLPLKHEITYFPSPADQNVPLYFKIFTIKWKMISAQF